MAVFSGCPLEFRLFLNGVVMFKEGRKGEIGGNTLNWDRKRMREIEWRGIRRTGGEYGRRKLGNEEGEQNRVGK